MPVLISEGIFVFLFPLKPVHDLFHTMGRRLRSHFIREATGATSSRTNTAGLCHFSPLETQSPRYYLEVGTDRCSTNFSVPDRQSSRIISWKNRALAAPSSAPFSVKHEKKKRERETNDVACLRLPYTNTGGFPEWNISPSSSTIALQETSVNLHRRHRSCGDK